MSKKILVVIGSTGKQGSGLCRYVLQDPELSKQYAIRAITRNAEKPEAQALKKAGAEVVEADIDDKESIVRALRGCHTIFMMTVPPMTAGGKEQEYNQAKRIADAAVECKLQYIIFSTLPHVAKLSNGKYTNVDPFDAKGEAEQYIRSLPIKSAFFSPTCFLQNFHSPVWGPRKTDDGTYRITSVIRGDVKMPMIDAVDDTGKYVGSILAEPEKYEGKVFHAGSELVSMDEIAAIMSKASGKTIKYQQVPVDVFESFFPDTFMAKVVIESWLYVQEFGYAGQDTEKEIKWALQHVRGKPTSCEEYFIKNPLNLQ